ncbi:MAG: hypothetical protein ABR551_11890 [Gemmatimonadales bacterium]
MICRRLAAVLVVVLLAGVQGRTAAQSEGPSGEVLTNASIAALVAAKLDRKLIIAKILDSPNAFDVTASGLVGLRQREIPKALIEVMLQSAAEAAAADVVTNQAVLQMVEGRLPNDLIIAKIRASSTAFDVTTEGLVVLQQRKVPRAIIQVMMEAGGSSRPGGATEALAVLPPSTAPQPPPANARPPMGSPAGPAPAPGSIASEPRSATNPLPSSRIPREAGIYMYLPSRPTAAPIRLEPTVYSASRTANMLGAALTGGISKAKIKAVVRSPRAAVQINDQHVEFYFVFEQQNPGLSASNSWFAQLTSPNEFSLVKFEVKSNTREVTVGEAGAFGAEMGTDDKANVQFTLERLSPGVYRVLTTHPLSVGQYAFLSVAGPMGSAGGAASPNRLFDFGVVGSR